MRSGLLLASTASANHYHSAGLYVGLVIFLVLFAVFFVYVAITKGWRRRGP